MSPYKCVPCLSVVLWVLSATSAEARGGFPSSEREFVLVNAGFNVCLTAVPERLAGEGKPCSWEDVPAEQRWRYEGRQLVNVGTGLCLLAPELVPCGDVAEADLSYNLLTQHLVLQQPAVGEAASCHVLTVGFESEPDVPGFSLRYLLGREPLESGVDCLPTQPTSRWVVIPLAP